jgi:2-polyprenyl-3-methyl-5-hydroxy-6-metoxy-1,4-benzoquinol methylase
MDTYADYSKWKGWLSSTPFAELAEIQSRRFAAQLDRLGIPYRNINALEIGFGNGDFMAFLKNNGSRVEGTEIQPSLLEAAKGKGFVAATSLDGLGGGPYDLIAAFDVLEHLTIEQLRELFAKCKPLLKPGGAMVFRFPNADSYAGMPAQHGDFTHITPIGQTKLWQLVEPHGLRIERFEGEWLYPRRPIVNAIRACFRYVVVHGTGIGNSYFFSVNVVAVVKHDDRG